MRQNLLSFFCFLILFSFSKGAYAQDQKAAGIHSIEVVSSASIIGARTDCTDGDAGGFECLNVDLISHLTLSDISGLDAADNVATRHLNDIWGWKDPENGDLYAVVGRNDGTSVVRMTDPENPVYVADLPLTAGAIANAWRDVKIYKSHAYVVADNAGNHGVQVFDLSGLKDVTGDPVVITAVATVDSMTSAHNIVINEESGFAYVVGGDLCGGALQMLNINDPANPIDAGCAAAVGTGRQGTGYVHDAQCTMYTGPDTEHNGKEICFTANESHVAIMDLSDKANPVVLSTATYPNASYIHQGWLNDSQSHFIVN